MNENGLQNKPKNYEKTIILLLVIFFIGIFLRTYNFHEWLRFSVDQSRDARIISDALENKSPMPLLGPKANTTTFKLGPVYYYLSYYSAKMFGNYPDKMAWPSLIFSILTIPLFYYFLREFFSIRHSLLLTALMTISYLMVFNSRFSSNPNLIPFFILLFLFSLLKILENDRNFFYWSILSGISFGIGIQLHTTLLVVLPIILFIFIIYLFFIKTEGTWKIIFIVMSITFLLNQTQLTYELNSGWNNTKSFMSGFKRNHSSNIFKGLLYISACQVQANSYYISSVISSPQNNSNNIRCTQVFRMPRNDRFFYFSTISIGILFSVIGFFLMISRWYKENIPKKKHFLGLLLLLTCVSLIVFMPIARMMNTGYLIMLFMVPFVMLGLVFEALESKIKNMGKLVTIGITILLVISSLFKDFSVAREYARGAGNTERGSTLGEIERMSRYIVSSSKGHPKIYFSGDKDLANRYFKPISYLVEKNGTDVKLISINTKINNLVKDIPVFYIKENGKEEITSGNYIKGREILSGEKFSMQTIYNLNNR
jgi:4-amino-4-deoxy-L-arabinose transferase-like glycosyltransferase